VFDLGLVFYVFAAVAAAAPMRIANVGNTVETAEHARC